MKVLNWCGMKVLSGVPHCSVLGPLLFLLFVNDRPDWIMTNIRIFADDTKIWIRITGVEDSESLKRDLDSLGRWSEKWLLRLNPEKCKMMHIRHSYIKLHTPSHRMRNFGLYKKLQKRKI